MSSLNEIQSSNAYASPPPSERKRMRFSSEEGLSFSSNSPSWLTGVFQQTLSDTFIKKPELGVHFQRQSTKKPLSPFLQKIVTIHEGGKIVREDGVVFPISWLAKGDYSDVYVIKGEEGAPHFIEGVPNDKVVVKMFRYDLFMENGPRQKSSRLECEQKWLPNILKQHKRVQEKLPVANIYNLETIREDGYLAMERVVPLPNLSLWNSVDLPKDEKVLAILDQLCLFFNFAFEDYSNHPLDLKLDNFGIREDGTVVLFDFKEEEEEVENGFSLIAKNCVRSCSKGNKQVAEYLCRKIKETSLYTLVIN